MARLSFRIRYTVLGLFVCLFFLRKVREDQEREGAELVFFSHSVLLKGCLTEMEQLLKNKIK